MSSFIKVGWFTLFLLAYCGWLYLSKRVLDRGGKDILKGKWFWSEQLRLLLLTAGFILFFWLLSGFFSPWMVALLFGGTELGVLVAVILLGVIGSTTTTWGPRLFLDATELALKNLWGTILLYLFLILAALAYPIIIGILYFTRSNLQAEQVFLCTLILVIPGTLVALILQTSGLVSKNLDEGTRVRCFIAQITVLISIALFLAIAIQVFGFKMEVIIPNKLFTSISSYIPDALLSPIPAFLIIILILCFLTLLPAYIGTRRAKEWHIELLERQKKLINDLLRILDPPTISSSELDELQKEIKYEIDQLLENEIVALGNQIDKGEGKYNPGKLANLPTWMRDFGEAYKSSRSLDPRFEYLNELNKLDKEVPTIIADLNQQEKIKGWKATLQHGENELNAKIKKVEEATSIFTSLKFKLAAPIVMVIISAIQTELGTLVKDYLHEALQNPPQTKQTTPIDKDEPPQRQ